MKADPVLALAIGSGRPPDGRASDGHAAAAADAAAAAAADAPDGYAAAAADADAAAAADDRHNEQRGWPQLQVYRMRHARCRMLLHMCVLLPVRHYACGPPSLLRYQVVALLLLHRVLAGDLLPRRHSSRAMSP